MTSTDIVTLEELLRSCRDTPRKVVCANKSAVQRASVEFGLHTERAIVDFIAEGLESLSRCQPSTSSQFPGVQITAYKFTTGKKKGYLAFHRYAGSVDRIYIKSFHLDDTDPSLGTLGDLFGKCMSGETGE